MTSEERRAKISPIADRQAIIQLLVNHSRGIDRHDEALLRSVYHPDGMVSYGFFDGTANDFAGIVVQSLEGAPITSHRSHGHWIKLAGDHAKSETYVIAYTEVPGETATQMLIGGRYLDRLERRAGKWGMVHRSYVLDWNINVPSSVIWTEGMYGQMTKGAAGKADVSAAVFSGWLDQSPKAKGNVAMTSEASIDAEIDVVLAKQALHDLVMTYCRGVDRADEALLASIWTPNATTSLGMFDGSGEEASKVVPRFERENLKRVSHTVANEWFDVRGDHAVGECYVIGVSTATVNGVDQDGLVGGRYLDRFERRDGVWKIAHRTFVMDWNMNQPSTAQWDGPMYGSLRKRGTMDKNDPVYAFWKD